MPNIPLSQLHFEKTMQKLYNKKTLSNLLLNELTIISDRLRNIAYASSSAFSNEEQEFNSFIITLLKENQEKIKRKMDLKTIAKQINKKLKFIH